MKRFNQVDTVLILPLVMLLIFVPAIAYALPSVKDPNLKVETFVNGLKAPVSMAFVGLGDVLVAEKEGGRVVRILNGSVISPPVIDLNVSIGAERGLLGIAIKKQEQRIFVYLSFIASSTKGDIYETNGTIPKGNLVYRYELIRDRLINPKILSNTTADGPFHYGGSLLVDNGFLYHIVGDLGAGEGKSHPTNAINIHAAPSPDGRAGILRIPIDNASKPNGIIGVSGILRLYYAYGIRNGFGIDRDPVSGKLWDTENGPDTNDEINLVTPGFNSGWRVVQGLMGNETRRIDIALSADPPRLDDIFDPALSADELMSLVNFGGKGKYRDPEFVWHHTVGVTAVKFYPYDRLGAQYKDDLFVGDFVNGNLYHFDVSKNRTYLVLHGLLKDKVADSPLELADVIFGSGFNGITDIKTGPDGYLYVVSLVDGTIYRIVPNIATSNHNQMKS